VHVSTSPYLSHRSLRCALGAILLALSSPARAGEVAPTSALYGANGEVVGFATSEQSLYFLAPWRWSLQRNASSAAARLVSADSSGDSFDLRLVLAPDYTHAAPAVVALRKADPAALFFPLPITVQRATLFLPEALGNIEAELTPDEESLATPVALYYRLRFSAEQLSTLRILANGGVALQGALEFAYAAPTGIETSAAPLTIVLQDADLVASPPAPPDPLAWLSDLLATMTLHVGGPIDGPYSLGGGIRVQIASSRLDAWLSRSSWSLDLSGDLSSVSAARVSPIQPEDLIGQIGFEVLPLGLKIQVNFRAAFAATLDLLLLQLAIDRLDLISVAINGAGNPFYTALLGAKLREPAVRAKIAAALSAELQRRILAHALFGLEEVLP
jgi:hypothetical protein